MEFFDYKGFDNPDPETANTLGSHPHERRFALLKNQALKGDRPLKPQPCWSVPDIPPEELANHTCFFFYVLGSYLMSRFSFRKGQELGSHHAGVRLRHVQLVFPRRFFHVEQVGRVRLGVAPAQSEQQRTWLCPDQRSPPPKTNVQLNQTNEQESVRG